MQSIADQPPRTTAEQRQSPTAEKSQNNAPASSTSHGSRRVPDAMTAQMNSIMSKMVSLTDDSNEETVFAVEIHTGFSGAAPLGLRPGVLLYDGPSKQDRLIGAASWHTFMSPSFYTFSIRSDLLLPPLVSGGGDSTNLVHEIMTARVDADHGVGFHFTVELGRDSNFARESFCWRKVNKHSTDDAGGGGFDLVQLPSAAERTLGMDGEKFATLRWLKKWTRPFALKFNHSGSAHSGVLDNRWRLVVVVTALRLWHLHVNGNTNKTMIAIGGKIRGKS